jgi:hypothetical protein
MTPRGAIRRDTSSWRAGATTEPRRTTRGRRCDWPAHYRERPRDRRRPSPPMLPELRCLRPTSPNSCPPGWASSRAGPPTPSVPDAAGGGVHRLRCHLLPGCGEIAFLPRPRLVHCRVRPARPSRAQSSSTSTSARPTATSDQPASGIGRPRRGQLRRGKAPGELAVSIAPAAARALISTSVAPRKGDAVGGGLPAWHAAAEEQPEPRHDGQRHDTGTGPIRLAGSAHRRSRPGSPADQRRPGGRVGGGPGGGGALGGPAAGGREPGDIAHLHPPLEIGSPSIDVRSGQRGLWGGRVERRGS